MENVIRIKQITIFLGIFLILVSANDPNKMTGKKMPSFSGRTLSDIEVNRNYFKGKITLLNFMNIGCPPCMAEISMLIRFKEQIQNEKFQILCISANTAQQLIGFNSSKDPIYNAIKNHFQVDSMTYDIMPECLIKKPDSSQNVFRPECDKISKLFKVNGYPATFLIDKKGVIKKVYEGFPMQRDSTYELSIKHGIESLINQ